MTLSGSDDYLLGNVESSPELECSMPLENETALEQASTNDVTPANPIYSTSVPIMDTRSPLVSEIPSPETLTHRSQKDEIVIPLWEERLKINRRKRKVGEVVIRKEVETHIIEVAIRREKLIVERVSPDYQQIAVVELGQSEVADSDSFESTSLPNVKGEFPSVTAAIQFLNAIATELVSDLQKVQIQVVLKDPIQQANYQALLDQYSSELNS